MFLGIVSILPFFVLIFSYGYSDDGLVHRDLVPWYVDYIVFPIALTVSVPFFILAFTGLFASVFSKSLSKRTLFYGFILFIIAILSTIGPKIVRDFLL